MPRGVEQCDTTGDVGGAELKLATPGGPEKQRSHPFSNRLRWAPATPRPVAHTEHPRAITRKIQPYRRLTPDQIFLVLDFQGTVTGEPSIHKAMLPAVAWQLLAGLRVLTVSSDAVMLFIMRWQLPRRPVAR